MEASDLAVVALVKAGDHDAFRHLVERHSRSVFRLAYRLTGHEQDAEDVVQETFLRAFREIRRFEARSSFATWLYRITVNYSHDLLRQRRGRQPAVSTTPIWLCCELADPSASANRARTGQPPHRRARQDAMNGLSAQERSAFVMRHFEGLSIEEIGHARPERRGQASIFRAVPSCRAQPVAELSRCAPLGRRAGRGFYREATAFGRRAHVALCAACRERFERLTMALQRLNRSPSRRETGHAAPRSGPVAASPRSGRAAVDGGIVAPP
jgi:RNA polymerase sigma-70 factor (ECF subfamily)